MTIDATFDVSLVPSENDYGRCERIAQCAKHNSLLAGIAREGPGTYPKRPSGREKVGLAAALGGRAGTWRLVISAGMARSRGEYAVGHGVAVRARGMDWQGRSCTRPSTSTHAWVPARGSRHRRQPKGSRRRGATVQETMLGGTIIVFVAKRRCGYRSSA